MTDDFFFDTDCLSAFLWINDTNILHELYGGRIVLPEPVYQELSNPCIPHIGQRTDLLLVDDKTNREWSFPAPPQETLSSVFENVLK